MFIAMKLGVRGTLPVIIAVGLTAEHLVETMVLAGIVTPDENTGDPLNLGAQYEGVLTACEKAVRLPRCAHTVDREPGQRGEPMVEPYAVYCV